jgi:hypothetical protein
MLFALTDQWQTSRALAEVAGIPLKGAGTVLLALYKQGHAERSRRMSRSPWNFGGGLRCELSQTAVAATSGAGVSVTV